MNEETKARYDRYAKGCLVQFVIGMILIMAAAAFAWLKMQ